MCLAIGALPNRKIPVEHMRNAWRTNPDGGGYAWRDPEKGSIVLSKGYTDVEVMIKDYERDFASVGEKSAFLMHFRVATHGRVNKDNTHPFTGKYGAFVHNGVIHGVASSSSIDSDTAELAKIMHDMPERAVSIFLKKAVVTLSYNKLVFLGRDSGNLIFYGEEKGEWVNGVWYSNMSYLGSLRDRGGRPDRGVQ